MPTIIATSVNLTEAPRPLPQYENLPSNPGHTNFVTLPDTHGNTSLISCHLSYCGILKNKFRHKNAAEPDSDFDADSDSNHQLRRHPKQRTEIVTVKKTPHEELTALYAEHAKLISEFRRPAPGINKENPSLPLKENISKFKVLLEKLDIANDKLSIRFLGDILADRGENDYLTLLLLAFLHNKKIPMEIIFSNHDAFFINAYLSDQLKNLEGIKRIPKEVSCSLQNLCFLIFNKVIDEEEIKSLTEKYYLPNLKLISYDVYQEDGHQKIKYYTHSAVDFEMTKDMAEKLGVLYQDDSMENFCNTLDNINIAFSAKVKSGELKNLIDETDQIRKIISDAMKLNKKKSQLKLLLEKNGKLDAAKETLRSIAFTAENLTRPSLTEEQINSDLTAIFIELQDDEKKMRTLLTHLEEEISKLAPSEAKNKILDLINTMPELMLAHKNAHAEYLKSLDPELNQPHHIKEAPLYTFLWSRIATASAKDNPNKRHVFSDDAGNEYHCKTECTLSTEGWKEQAVNCHGHVGPFASLIDIDKAPAFNPTKSKHFQNLDSSDLGKGSDLESGDLVQQLSVNTRAPKNMPSDVATSSNLARFSYAAAASNTPENNPSSPPRASSQ